MKIMDRNGRLFGRISVIDILVLLVVAVMAVALYVKTNARDITSTSIENDKIVFQLYVQGVRAYVGDALHTGDLIYDDSVEAGGAVGEIIDIQILPGTKKAYYYAEGQIDMKTPAEDCVDVILTIQGEGIYSGGQYMINRIYHLGLNANRTYYTKYATFNGTVWAIQP